MKRDILSAIACAAFVALAVIFCFSSAPAQEKKNLRIVFVSLSWNNQLPFRVAIAKGYFRDQGLTVEPIFVRGGPTAIAAIVSGNVDFGSIGGAQAAIRSRARGLDLQIIASLSNFTNYTLIASREIKRLEDLRGKVIGVTGAGSFSDFTIRLLLKRNNLDPDKDKGYSLIVNLNEALRVPQSIYVTTGEMLEKYPETTKRFLQATILGMQLAKHDKREAIKGKLKP